VETHGAGGYGSSRIPIHRFRHRAVQSRNVDRAAAVLSRIKKSGLFKKPAFAPLRFRSGSILWDEQRPSPLTQWRSTLRHRNTSSGKRVRFFSRQK